MPSTLPYPEEAPKRRLEGMDLFPKTKYPLPVARGANRPQPPKSPLPSKRFSPSPPRPSACVTCHRPSAISREKRIARSKSDEPSPLIPFSRISNHAGPLLPVQKNLGAQPAPYLQSTRRDIPNPTTAGAGRTHRATWKPGVWAAFANRTKLGLAAPAIPPSPSARLLNLLAIPNRRPFGPSPNGGRQTASIFFGAYALAAFSRASQTTICKVPLAPALYRTPPTNSFPRREISRNTRPLRSFGSGRRTIQVKSPSPGPRSLLDIPLVLAQRIAPMRPKFFPLFLESTTHLFCEPNPFFLSRPAPNQHFGPTIRE